MKLAILDLSNFNKFDQYIRIRKETKEMELAMVSASFNDDIEDDKKEANKALESEIWDVIQSCYGLLNILGDAEQSNLKHVEKLKGYEDIGRIPKILGWVEMKEDK